MRACVWLRGPDGEEIALGSGDVIGRAWSASLRVDDPRVSEAHALVSLRGDRLKLLSLRGRFVVAGEALTEHDLAAGQIVELSPDSRLEVLDVLLPPVVMALEGDGLAATAVHGSAALVVRSVPMLVHATASDAQAWLWPGPDGMRVRLPGEEPRTLAVGEELVVVGRTFRLVAIPLAGHAATVDRSAARLTLQVVVRYETAHLHRSDGVTGVLDGVQARLLSELVSFDCPVAWKVLAEQLWKDSDDPLVLRKRLDGALWRLRRSLRSAGLRDDLVRPNGQGQFEVFLMPGDRVREEQ